LDSIQENNKVKTTSFQERKLLPRSKKKQTKTTKTRTQKRKKQRRDDENNQTRTQRAEHRSVYG